MFIDGIVIVLLLTKNGKKPVKPSPASSGDASKKRKLCSNTIEHFFQTRTAGACGSTSTDVVESTESYSHDHDDDDEDVDVDIDSVVESSRPSTTNEEHQVQVGITISVNYIFNFLARFQYRK
jgi:hypothetical protein